MITTPSINIVAGESIPYIKEAFGSIGNIKFFPGRAITASEVKDAQILLIRSITQVNEALLKDSPVTFVGSASAGTDHIDSNYLRSRNIGFASAAGSNANSVAEYVIAGLLTLGQKLRFSLEGKTIGIIGVGNIGSLVKQKCQALGMVPILHDPPLAEAGKIDHRSLEETLGSDVVTLHTPLTTEGPYPTFHLLNEQTVRWLKPSAIFINASRGEVVDSEVLLHAITHKKIGPTILDVWENEPTINWSLFQASTLGTPHIAGHSLDGKANGTFMIYSALCKHFGLHPRWDPEQTLPPPVTPSMSLDHQHLTREEYLAKMVSTVYNIETDHERLGNLLHSPPDERPSQFDALRKNYPVRREFHRTQITLPPHTYDLKPILTGLGFSKITG